MGDKNPIRTLGDYSRPSHEGYRNTIELPEGNNVVPLRSDTIRLVQNGCSFHGLRFEDPNQHLKDFLKLVDSLDLDVANRERTRLREEEKNDDDNATTGDSIKKPDGLDAEMPLKEVEKENEAKNGTKNEPIKSAKKELTRAKEEEAVEAPSSQSEWEERIVNFSKKRRWEFNQWEGGSKTLNNKHPATCRNVKIEINVKEKVLFVRIKSLHDDLGVIVAKLMLLVYKLLLPVFGVNAASTKLQLLKRLRLPEDFLLPEKGRKPHLLEDKQIPSVGVFDEVSFYTLFRALGWHLEEIHVTWAHLEKKRTRLRLYTIYLEELCLQRVETASQTSSDNVRIFMVTASWI
ncbi:hypothetical protein Tco_1017447 [Tanacetum coccineum]|uniref:MAK10-like protein n=1 Tax=Tanacetum coccineum TaxID=301880 RepID=A0ABQ5FTH5_9ASTR